MLAGSESSQVPCQQTHTHTQQAAERREESRLERLEWRLRAAAAATASAGINYRPSRLLTDSSIRATRPIWQRQTVGLLIQTCLITSHYQAHRRRLYPQHAAAFEMGGNKRRKNTPMIVNRPWLNISASSGIEGPGITAEIEIIDGWEFDSLI